MSWLGQLKTKLQELEAQKNTLNAQARNSAQMHESQDDMNSIWYTIGGTVLTLYCMFKTFPGADKTAQGGATGATGGGASGGGGGLAPLVIEV